jgi:RimJ/RimL family protein N-acetyltransferase
MRPDDAGPLVERRNDPEVARYQDWTLPYPLERAEELIAAVSAVDGPGESGWSLTVADRDDTAVLGDLYVGLAAGGRTADIGYTFARDRWGAGYAVEAVSELVRHLFEDLDVARVGATLHPDNVASAMLLERVGMRFEGHTRSSFWLDGEGSDDWLYGMTRDDWTTWNGRPRHRPEVVELVEITSELLLPVTRLVTHRTQERFVAPVLQSLAEALVPPVEDGVTLLPWYRAAAADGDLVGFVMLARSQPGAEEPWLWRLLVDRLHQRRGIGARIIDLVVEQCREWGDPALRTSWVPGRGSPEPMYLARGFVPTGEVDDGEIVGRLPLR